MSVLKSLFICSSVKSTALSFATFSTKNKAALYIGVELVSAILIWAIIATVKVADSVKNHVEVSFSEEQINLDEKYSKIFEPFYKQIPLVGSKIPFIVSVIVDVLIFVGLVVAGWQGWAIFHAIFAALTQKGKAVFFPMVVSKLKSLEAPETEETIDELADKLFNGE